MRLPPLLPPECVYTSCYCEENIYLLCKTFSSDPETLEAWDIDVVFMSNENKTVALWSQKAGQLNYPVIWDYHVILILKSKIQGEGSNTSIDLHQGSVVYDLDTTLAVPCSWNDYFSSTFLDVPPRYQSKFRVIPGELFLKHFASNRSHMLVKPEVGNDGTSPEVPFEGQRYLSPPPSYPPIRGQSALDRGIDHNLMSHYVEMFHTDDSGTYGKVYGLEVVNFF